MPPNRSPAFSLYPDKALAGTDHLSPIAFKAYWKALFWMWLHSPDFCSIPNDPDFIRRRLGLTPAQYRKYWEGEIMAEHDPLLKNCGNFLRSHGLEKEKQKQDAVSESARSSANSRWNRADAMRTHEIRIAEPMRKGCFPTPTPTPSTKKTSSVLGGGEGVQGCNGDGNEPETESEQDAIGFVMRGIYADHPALKIIHEFAPFGGITVEQWRAMVGTRSRFLDLQAAAAFVVTKAKIAGPIAKPSSFISSHLGYWEKDHRKDIEVAAAAYKDRLNSIREVSQALIEARGHSEDDPISGGSGRTWGELQADAIEGLRKRHGEDAVKSAIHGAQA